MIPVIDNVLADDCSSVVKHANPRKQNWRRPQPIVGNSAQFEFATKQIRYKGRAKRFIGYEYTPTYSSYVVIDNERIFLHQLGKLVKVITPIAGMNFGHDEYGVYIQKGEHQFHPYATDLKLTKRELVKLVNNHVRGRNRADYYAKESERANKRVAQFMKPENFSKVWCTVEDSYLAGNCKVGTEQVYNKIVNKLEATGEIGSVRGDFLHELIGKRAIEVIKQSVIRRLIKRKTKKIK